LLILSAAKFISDKLVYRPRNPKLISEDDDRRGHDDVQKMTDAHITRLEDLAKIKEKEVMEI
jgi:ribosome recycling factor